MSLQSLAAGDRDQPGWWAGCTGPAVKGVRTLISVIPLNQHTLQCMHSQEHQLRQTREMVGRFLGNAMHLT